MSTDVTLRILVLGFVFLAMAVGWHLATWVAPRPVAHFEHTFK